MTCVLAIFRLFPWAPLQMLILLFFPAGLGRTAPDPGAAVSLEGVQVPLGKGVHTNIDDTSLLYNEYPLTPTTRCMNMIIILSHMFFAFLINCRSISLQKGSSQRISKYILF